MNDKNSNGRVLYEGLSPINKKKYAVIVTGFNAQTSNKKTGNMYQTWILNQDIKPNEAFKNKEYGETVCGNCPHSGWNQNSCYVKWFHAPLNVWKAYKNNRYECFDGNYEIFKNKSIRFGSAGDPVLIPIDIVKNIIKVAKNHTGYTHMWRNTFALPYKGLFQASVDSFQEYLQASSLGFNCFLVKHESVNDPKGFIHCPASVESGQKTSCNICSLCDGNTGNVVINAHGNTKNNVLLTA